MSSIHHAFNIVMAQLGPVKIENRVPGVPRNGMIQELANAGFFL